MLEVIDAQEKGVGGSMTGACAQVGDVAEDEDNDATADGGGSDSSARAVRSGDGAEMGFATVTSMRSVMLSREVRQRAAPKTVVVSLKEQWRAVRQSLTL